jgi:hypothetical protein
VFTAPLPNKDRGADHIETNLSIVEACLPRDVFTESLPSNGYTRHNIVQSHYFSLKCIQYDQKIQDKKSLLFLDEFHEAKQVEQRKM